MIRKILELFVNTLFTNGKYSHFKRDNVTQPIQMELSKNENGFCQYFPDFLKSRSNPEHFKKNNDPYSLCISEITDFERPG